MEKFSVFATSFDHCLYNLSLILAQYEEKNLVLNWEKMPFYGKKRHCFFYIRCHKKGLKLIGGRSMPLRSSLVQLV